MKKKYLSSLLFLIFIITQMASATALNDELDNEVRRIAHKLRCPTCQALSVKESEAGLAANMKMKIREMLQQGSSEDEILQFFQDRYGEWILRSPNKKGFNLVLWLVPGIIMVIAAIILTISLKNRNKSVKVETKTPLSESEKKRIKKELNQLKEK